MGRFGSSDYSLEQNLLVSDLDELGKLPLSILQLRLPRVYVYTST